MDEAEKLRATVQDERARRYWAERELERQKEKTAIWRQRAEDRKTRIADLQAQRQRRGPLLGRARGLRKTIRRQTTPDEAIATASNPSPQLPSQSSQADKSDTRTSRGSGRLTGISSALNPAIRIATLGSPKLAFLNEFETVPIADDRDVIYGSDGVFVSVSALIRAAPSILDELEQWLDAVARQPLAVWVDAEIPDVHRLRAVIDRADVRLASPDHVIDAGIDAELFDPGFDPMEYNPIGWSPKEPDDIEEADGLRVWTRDGVPVVAALIDTWSGPPRFARLLAQGVPVFGNDDVDVSAPLLRVGDGLSTIDVAELVAYDDALLTRMSILGRRLAFHRCASGSRSLAFLELMNLDPPRVEPCVGAILMTNRPEYLVSSVQGILQQEDVSVALTVGLHGNQSAFKSARGHVERVTEDRPIQILEFDGGTTLGAALNRAADECSYPILAKIDDDDWYGPHFMSDALAALRYSASDIVGKARYHVEIESTGDTYLVDGPEEAFTQHVIGSSMVFRRRLWEDVHFPHKPSRVDSIFLRGVRSTGAKIYANNRFEFGVRRTASGHTWNVDPAFFAARGERIGRALSDARLSVTSSEVCGISLP